MTLIRNTIFPLLCLLLASYWFFQAQSVDSAPTSSKLADLADESRQAQIASAIEQAHTEVTADNLDEYLESLIKQAQLSGRATSLEVEPGVEMIMAITQDPQQIADFTARMQAVNNPTQHSMSEQEAEQKLFKLIREIEVADGQQQSDLVTSYLETAGSLSPEAEADAVLILHNTLGIINKSSADEAVLEEMLAHEAANAQLSQADPQQSVKSKLDVLAQQIANSNENTQRNTLIETYLMQIIELNPSEQTAALQTLSSLLPTSNYTDSTVEHDPAFP